MGVLNVNEIMQMFNIMSKGGGNPKQIAQQLIMNNPEAQAVFMQMQNMANGLTPREFALKYAKQNGISEQEVLNFARQFGLN